MAVEQSSKRSDLARLFDLSGRVAVVTGGSAGIGKQMAEGLAEAGASLVLAARKEERCREVAADLSQRFQVKAVPVRCDVANLEDIAALAQVAVSSFGTVDILVNNAGATWGAPAGDYPLEKWQYVFDVNVRGMFALSQQLFEVMKQQGRGSIINIASVAGLAGMKPEVMDAVAYNSSKGAVIALTKDLAVKWARYGVRVNAIAPGWFPSHMTGWVLEHHGDEILRRIPLGRFGGEADLKGAVVYLASAASEYVTGHILSVDGGWAAS